ncbi:MAG: hypothetical protein AB1505_10255 [Candidatus Latescibacterota bacterium]
MRARGVAAALLVAGVALAALYGQTEAQRPARRGAALSAQRQAQRQAVREQRMATMQGQCRFGRAAGGPGLLGLAEELDLTDEQRTQLEALREEFRTRVQEMRQGDTPPTAEELQQLGQEHKARVQEILTDEQEAKLEELRQARQDAAWDGGRGGHRGPFGPFRLFAALDLTDEQKTQLKALHQEFRIQMQELRQSGTRPTIEELQQLHQEHMEQIRALLTPVQQARLDELLASRPRWGRHGAGTDTDSGTESSTEGGASAKSAESATPERTWGQIKDQAR